MSAVNSLRVLFLAIAAAACGQGPEQPANNLAANTPVDVEVLPPDESAAMPTDELANGAADPNGNEAAPDGN